MERKTHTGRVAGEWRDNNYNFIRPDDGGKDIFMHVTALAGIGEPNKGDAVQFEVESSPKGLRAINVRPA